MTPCLGKTPEPWRLGGGLGPGQAVVRRPDVPERPRAPAAQHPEPVAEDDRRMGVAIGPGHPRERSGPERAGVASALGEEKMQCPVSTLHSSGRAPAMADQRGPPGCALLHSPLGEESCNRKCLCITPVAPSE